MKILKFLGAVVVLFIVACGIGYLGLVNSWYGDFTLKYRANDYALSGLQNSDMVRYEEDRWITFTPKESTPQTAFIFYPCAGCDYRAAAPMLRDIAEAGFLTIVTPVPSNYAILGSGIANDIVAAHPEIKNWVLAGHSMGGGGVAMFLRDFPGVMAGAVYWDSYTNETYSINHVDIPVRAIYGDTHHNPERPVIFENAKQFFPPDTEYVPIKGGDHFGFGFYMDEDIACCSTGTISKQDQAAQVVESTIDFLKRF